MESSATSDLEDPRRQVILEAAAELFFRDGYAATSIDAIIARTGGSKRTIYALFGNKKGLFEALVRENSQRLFAGLAPGMTETAPLETVLRRFAEQLLDLLMRPRTVAVFRIAVSEAQRFPDLAQSFNALGPGPARLWLADVLARAQRQGEIRHADPTALTDQFFGLIRGNLYFDLVLGLRTPPDREELAGIAHAATSVFLDGLRPDR